ncbi:DNA repair protein RAD51 homolog 4-like [Liolophura sinensis]|uniref:DNA repair protein RAD51 homolog 4-like n=1 Tax=Liolophura sinensis TaxID=3198878 RepID=UPI0031580B7C
MPKLRVGMCTGATPKLLQTLEELGICSVTDYISSNLEKISSERSLPYKDLLSIRRVLLAQYSAFPVTGADVYTHLLSSVSILSTGSQVLDQLLDGGIYTGELTEVVGDISAGKTQLCFTVAAVVAMETNKSVLFIDTCGSFTAERLEEVLEERGCKDIPASLNCICCEQKLDIFSLLEMLEETRSNLARKSDDFHTSLKLIVVDSVTRVISPVLGGQQSDGHALMCQIGLKLRLISSEFSCAVLVTNNLLGADFGAVNIALGRTWLHSPHTRVVLQRQEKTTANTRRARLAKSSRLAISKGSVVIQLTPRGVDDVT